MKITLQITEIAVSCGICRMRLEGVMDTGFLKGKPVDAILWNQPTEDYDKYEIKQEVEVTYHGVFYDNPEQTVGRLGNPSI